MKDAFSSYHPLVNFFYFCAVIVCGMFFLHPVFLMISLSAAFAYSVYLNRRKAVMFNCFFLLPLILLVALVNPLFNHGGVTILGYLGNNPVTLESILYGVFTGFMFAGVILWFSCYNAVMSSDKFIYLFGRVIPSMSLIFSMVLRFIPKFKNQAKVIAGAQKCIGRDPESGGVLTRAKHGVKILSILTTWALENAVDTADSMNARGYGLPKRTAFANFRFDGRDRTAMIVLAMCFLIVLSGAFLGQNTMRFFPSVRFAGFTWVSATVYASYFLLCYFPLLLGWKEERTWRRLRSRM